ncbi:MAG TPA: amino acid ABC transporter permease [Virgibacillus sp.]|nr:amino acid ABC transporter permease [Virgibacillus sp.]
MSQYFDLTHLIQGFPQLLAFLGITLMVTALAVIFGTALGLIIMVFKLSESRLLRFLGNLYTTLMRCTPSIVLLFLVYYGVPAIAESLNIYLHDVHSGVFVVLTFTIQFAAIMSEVLRSAYLSVDKQQYEAGVSVGLTSIQTYIRIIIPQAVIVALPNFANALLELLKEGSLAYTIGFIDMMGKANLIVESNFNAHALEIYLALSLIYWSLSLIIEYIFSKVEQRFSKKQRQPGTI